MLQVLGEEVRHWPIVRQTGEQSIAWDAAFCRRISGVASRKAIVVVVHVKQLEGDVLEEGGLDIASKEFVGSEECAEPGDRVSDILLVHLMVVIADFTGSTDVGGDASDGFSREDISVDSISHLSRDALKLGL
jgi:hypothetical protein